ncbi:MAG: hypothetical protein PHC91_03885 [Eubacteriales bacterium]|nr:hypothetical protein [Eubacteriales bacterium]
MFKYKLEKTQNRLFIYLPEKLNFSIEFINELTYVFKLVMNKDFKNVLFSCDANCEFDKLCLAYLDNTIKYVSKTKRVFWNYELQNLILNTVVRKRSNDFQEIVLATTIKNHDIPMYVFDGYDDVSQTVNKIVDILIDQNIAINKNQIKEFLSTTIGEIFSNAINHSNQKNFFFAYDLIYSKEEEDFYLVSNVIDYGTTLVKNVKLYFEKQKNKSISSQECFYWAIEEGNTTRDGSGGFGLSTFISYLKAVNGEMMIFSGDASCTLQKNKAIEVQQSKGNYPGTSVTFKVKLFDVSKCLLCSEKESKISFKSVSLEDI